MVSKAEEYLNLIRTKQWVVPRTSEIRNSTIESDSRNSTIESENTIKRPGLLGASGDTDCATKSKTFASWINYLKIPINLNVDAWTKFNTFALRTKLCVPVKLNILLLGAGYMKLAWAAEARTVDAVELSLVAVADGSSSIDARLKGPEAIKHTRKPKNTQKTKNDHKKKTKKKKKKNNNNNINNNDNINNITSIVVIMHYNTSRL